MEYQTSEHLAHNWKSPGFGEISTLVLNAPLKERQDALISEIVKLHLSGCNNAEAARQLVENAFRTTDTYMTLQGEELSLSGKVILIIAPEVVAGCDLVAKFAKPLQRRGAAVIITYQESAEAALLKAIKFDLAIGYADYNNERGLSLARLVAPVDRLNMMLLSPLGLENPLGGRYIYDRPHNLADSTRILGSARVGTAYIGGDYGERDFLRNVGRLL